MKTRSKVLCLLLFYPVMGILIYFRTDGFLPEKALTFLPNAPCWENHSLLPKENEEIKSILSQKYYYLGSGRQCFVFESEDGKYVVKLLNHERFIMANWAKAIPLPSFFDRIRLQKIEKREGRVQAFFRSFQIGYEILPEETGIIFLQLNKGGDPLFLRLSGPGYTHTIPLHETEYILQRKVDSFYHQLKKHSQDPLKWKKILSSYVDFLERRIQKGVIDDDRNVFNLGYDRERTILIDAGRLTLDPTVKEYSLEEMKKSSTLLQRKLDKEFPEMGKFLKEAIERGS